MPSDPGTTASSTTASSTTASSTTASSTTASGSDGVFVKQRAEAPEGFFAAEAAGLRWLGEATPDGGARVAEVLAVSRGEIRLRRLTTVPPAPVPAEAFGRALASTHRSGAPAHGWVPPDAGGRAWIGPEPLPAVPPAARPGRW